MKVENYGEMLGKVSGKPCIAFEQFGSYQGDWVAVLDAGDDIELYKGRYGSCSGCDWLEDEGDYLWSNEDTEDKGKYEVDDEKAKTYFAGEHAFLVIPKSIARDMTLDTFNEVFPANTRADIYDFEPEKMLQAIKSSIKD